VGVKWILLLMASVPALGQQLSPQRLWLTGRFDEAKQVLVSRQSSAPDSGLDSMAADFELERGNYAEANALLRRARPYSRIEALDKALGQIYRVRGRPEAREIFEKALPLARKGWPVQWVAANVGLARARLSLGDPDAAAAEQARDAAKGLWGNNSIPVLDALDALGMARLAQSRHEEAEQILNATLQVRISLYGAQHFKVGESFLHLARVEAACGDPDKAIVLADRALENLPQDFHRP
jgi:tetratricopeptide (TPR) repeat protein